MRVLYVETWKQYCHEDTLGQNRTTGFMAIHTAFIAILALAAMPLLQMNLKALACAPHVQWGVVLFGGLVAGLGVTSWFVDKYWAEVNSAGRDYVKLRRATLIAIEASRGLDSIGPASIEDKWECHPRDKPFTPYEERPGLIVRGYPSTEGWSSTKKIVKIMRVVHEAQTILGLLLLAIGFCGG